MSFELEQVEVEPKELVVLGEREELGELELKLGLEQQIFPWWNQKKVKLT